jgi:hypothetical protein
MDHPAALHRLQVGVPATVEHSSEAGPETGKWVAETTQVRLLHDIFPSSFCFYISLLMYTWQLHPTPFCYSYIPPRAL